MSAIVSGLEREGGQDLVRLLVLVAPGVLEHRDVRVVSR